MKRLLFLLSMILLISTVHADEWERVRLTTQAQVTNGVGGGEGGQMLWDIVYAPSNPSICYMVGDENQVWKSTDGGYNWNMANDGIDVKGGVAIVVDPTDPDIVLLAGSMQSTKTPTPNTSPYDGIYRTTNGGTSWTLGTVTHYLRASVTSRRGGTRFAFDPNNHNKVYAATDDVGILRSTDNGATWSSTGILPTNKIRDIKFHPTDSAILYFCVNDGVANDGLWKVSNVGTATSGVKINSTSIAPRCLSINPSDPTIMYIAQSGSGVGFSKSTNSGVTWSSINTGITFGGTTQAQSIAVSPSAPTTIYASLNNTGGIRHPIHSTNSGANWSHPTDNDDLDLAADIFTDNSSEGYDFGSMVCPHPTDSTKAIAFSTHQPAVTTNTGGTWRLASGYSAGSLNSNGSIDFYDTNTIAVGFSDLGIFKTNDAKTTWSRMNTPTYAGHKSVNAIAYSPSGSSTIFAWVGAWTTSKFALHKTTNGGASWTLPQDTVNGTNCTSGWGSFLEFNPDDSSVIYADSYRSTNTGTSFVTNTMSNNANRGVKIFGMSPTDGNSPYAYYRASGSTTMCVYTSADKGATWGTHSVFNTSAIDATPYGMAVGSAGKMWIAFGDQGLYEYSGSSWSKLTALNDAYSSKMEVRAVAAVRTNPIVVYAGCYNPYYMSNGVWRSADNGTTWENITGTTLGPAMNVYSLAVDTRINKVYAGTYHGIWALNSLPPNATQTVVALRSLDTMTIDGQPNEGAWIQANSVTLNTTFDGVGTLKGSVTAKVLWQQTDGTSTLYVLTEAADPSKTNDSVGVYEDSSVELYFDGDYDRSPTYDYSNDRQFVFGWGDVSVGYAQGTTTGVTVAYGTNATNGNWYSEWKITCSNFYPVIGTSGSTREAGSCTGFSVGYNYDPDGGVRNGQTGWAGDGNNYISTANLGDLLFGTETAGGFAVPTVVTGTVTPIGTSSATLKGTITANGYSTDAWFIYGTQSGNLTSTTTTSNFTGGSPGALSKAITGLNQSTTYYYQAVGSSSAGVVNGSESSFVTGSVPSIDTMTGCTFWWKFDETTGTTTTADSVGTNTGSLVNQATWTTGIVPMSGSGTWTTGALGKAISLDGVNDKVTMNQMIGSPTQYSMSGWAYVIGSDTTGATLVSIGDYAGILTQNNSTALNQAGFRYDGTTWRSTGSTTVSPFNQWHHWVFSVDDTNNSQTLYIDGVYGTTSTWAANTSWVGQGTKIVIGAHGNGGSTADLYGYIDDVRIFNNKVISAQEAIDLATIPVITGAGSATAITSSSCTFVGTAATNGSISANIYVQYGTQSGAYTGTTTPQINLVESTTSSVASWTVTGLTPGTTTYYRLQIVSDAYTVSGGEGSFTTSVIAGAPVSVTYPATAIGSQTVTLNGSSTPTGLSTTALFRYGTSSNYTGTSSTVDVGSGVSAVNVSKTITGLSQGTLYVYCLQSTNSLGTANGSELSFTTTDTTIPTGTISINNGAIGINSGSATVLMEATDNTGIVAYSLQGTSTNPGVGSWTTITTTTSFISAVPYNLSSGEGTKQIWGWFKDGWGNTSTVSTDTIILDTTDPTIMITSPTLASTYNAHNTSVSLGGTATDSGSLLASVDWSNSQTSWTGTASGTSTWTASSISLAIGVNTLTVVSTDNAGNVSSDVINVTGEYSVEQVAGFSKPLSMSIIYSTQFQQGLRNYGVRFDTTWRSTADILRLIANPDTEITNAIVNR